MASISSSWTSGTDVDSQSSMVWKVRSASGIYHLQSYCCAFLWRRGQGQCQPGQRPTLHLNLDLELELDMDRDLDLDLDMDLDVDLDLRS